MYDVKTVLMILAQSSEYLEKHGVEMPRLTAEIIISKILKMKRLNLYLEYNRPIFENELSQIRESMIKRGKERMPIEYIFNSAEFYSREFYVDERVLIPRIETELVVEEALKRIKKIEKPEILDIGSGSGAIGLTLALERIDANITAVDISQDALDVTRLNREYLKVKNHYSLVSDIFEGLALKSFDLIISNPPYIACEVYNSLSKETLKEPKIALVAENRGMSIYERILSKANFFLKKKGLVIFEIGYDQEYLILEIFRHYGYKKCEVLKDYFGQSRIAIGYKEE